MRAVCATKPFGRPLLHPTSRNSTTYAAALRRTAAASLRRIRPSTVPSRGVIWALHHRLARRLFRRGRLQLAPRRGRWWGLKRSLKAPQATMQSRGRPSPIPDAAQRSGEAGRVSSGRSTPSMIFSTMRYPSAHQAQQPGGRPGRGRDPAHEGNVAVQPCQSLKPPVRSITTAVVSVGDIPAQRFGGNPAQPRHALFGCRQCTWRICRPTTGTADPKHGHPRRERRAVVIQNVHTWLGRRRGPVLAILFGRRSAYGHLGSAAMSLGPWRGLTEHDHDDESA